MSEFIQQSFNGGMNLLLDDTRLAQNQYRVGFNLRNRYDVLEPVQSSELDVSIPSGVKQEMITFGNYVVVFVDGYAYYRLYSSEGWTKITSFAMSGSAPRFWTVAVPVATTLYGRIATTNTQNSKIYQSSLNPVISTQSTASTFGGNVPGLLVQDGVSQPMFIFLDGNGTPIARTTQTYDQWDATYGTTSGDYGIITDDKREYVPVGTAMAWVDGVLYIVAPDGINILRSVSGRPLDFVINVKPDGSKGGNAYTTSYSVGVGNISCLRGMQDGSLFVAAGNSNFAVSKNLTNLAPKQFGEYTFIRKFLFESTCLSDRVIFDSLGDTRFVDLTGVRSFNAIQQLNNEGRNSSFTAPIAAAFKNLVQDVAAAILYDNYELYGVNTIFGAAIAVYDTLSQTWVGFDTLQTGGSKIKQFAKIELGVQRLYAITEDDKIYSLYSSANQDLASFLTAGMRQQGEGKLQEFRLVLNRITEDVSVSIQPYVNNRASVDSPVITKTISYSAPVPAYTGNIPDLGTQLTNVYFTTPNTGQGWKTNVLVTWDEGSLTQFSAMFKDINPMNPLKSQGVVS